MENRVPERENLGDSIQESSVWRILGARMITIAVFAACGAALAFTFSILQPTTYNATATIEVSKQGQQSVANARSSAPVDFISNEELTTYQLTLEQELQSAAVARRVITETNLISEKPYSSIAQSSAGSAFEENKREARLVELFQTRLKVQMVKDTKLITVTFTDSNPERAAQVANAVIDTYVRSDSEARIAASEKTSGLLSGQLTDLRKQVLDSEQKLSEYKERTGIVDPDDTGSTKPDSTQNSNTVVVERFIQLNRDLTSAEVSLVQRQALAATMQRQGPDAILEVLQRAQQSANADDAAFAGDAFNSLTSLRQQRSRLKLQVASSGQYLGPASPQMIQLQNEITVLDGQIGEEIERVKQHILSQLQVARITEAGLQQLVQAQQRAVGTLNYQVNQLHVLQQEAQSKRALYQDLYAKRQEEDAYKGMNPATATVVDPARPPIVKAGPKITRNTFSGLVLGGLAGVLYALVQSPGSLLVLAVMLTLCGSLVAQNSVSVSSNIDQLSPSGRRATSQAAQVLPGVPVAVSNAPLSPGFLVRLEIFGVPEMSTDLRVGPDGNLNVPVLGSVHVEDLTQTQAAVLLGERYVAAKILVHPQITLTLLSYSTITVTVLGEVQSPGLIQLTPPATVRHALALAGGETNAASNRILLQHRSPGKASEIGYARGGDLADSPEVKLADGDSIYVPKAGIIYVLGSVARPGGYVMVDHGGMNVLEAVSLAQGTTIIAATSKVYILRAGENGTYQTLTVPYKKMTRGKEAPVQLFARDIVYVPASGTKSLLINGSSLIGAAATSAVYATRGP